MKYKKRNKFWLNEDGSAMSEEELKLASSQWTANEWELYLESLEHQSKDILMDAPELSENLSQEKHTHFVDLLSNGKDFSVMKSRIAEALNELSIKQKYVVKQLFWEDRKLRQVADAMGISSVAVLKLRDRALKKVGLLLLNNLIAIESRGENSKRQSLIANAVRSKC